MQVAELQDIIQELLLNGMSPYDQIEICTIDAEFDVLTVDHDGIRMVIHSNESGE